MKTNIKLLTCVLVAAAAALTGSRILAVAVVSPGTQPLWTVGAFTLKEPNLQLGATKAYRTWFENGAWQGDLVEYDVDTSGNRSTDVTVGANPATDGTNNWSARFEFANKESTVTDYWKAASGGRQIITYNTDSSSQVAFRWNTISGTQKIQLDSVTEAAALTGAYDSPVLNYVRGDRSLETTNGGTYRKRFSLMGDTGKVTPVYVGAPQQSYPFTGYAQYKVDNASRAGRVFQPANDGMIHVFDAATGIEVYAYVPSMLLTTLVNLTAADYIHTWYADGQLASGDARIGSSWKTLVAGGLGAGAKGLFALDATTPTLSSETSTNAADIKVLWEKTGNDIGYIHGKPVIAPVDSNWYVISGNGYLSVTDKALLCMMPAGGGTPVTIATDNTTGNGLSAPALVDTDYDSKADIAYAGDLLGNLWKFDLHNPGTAAELVFSAGSGKPITTAPDVAVHPNGGYLVYFGTGSLLSAADAADTTTQTVYAIWDYPGRSGTITDGVDGDGNQILLSQTLSTETYVNPDDNSQTLSVRTATANSPNWAYNRGWKTDLNIGGERVIGDVQLRGARLQFTSDTPVTDDTHPIGESWLLELHWLSGGDPGVPFFDLNGDTLRNDSDKVTLADASLAVPVGKSLGMGNRSQPSFARVANGSDTIFINGVDPQFFDPSGGGCEGVCAGGVAGGHFDVDTDVFLGGKTDGHKHEYDDLYNVTYADYYEMGFLSDGKLANIDSSAGDKVPNIDVNTEFVVLIANAGLSPGGHLTLNTKTYNVVDYQEMIKQELLAYDGNDSNVFVDADGDSLVFTLQQIADAGGTLRISFNDRAIIQGGLIPTATGCVQGNDFYNETRRYRDGALIFHVIKLSEIKNGTSDNNVWIAQTPVDPVAGIDGGGVMANLFNNYKTADPIVVPDPAVNPGFLYESTIFWHWNGDVAKIIFGDGGFCYGDTSKSVSWEEATKVEREGVTLEQFEAAYPNYATQQDRIEELIAFFGTLTCGDKSGVDCAKELGYEDLKNELKNLVGDINKFLLVRSYIGGVPVGDGSGSGNYYGPVGGGGSGSGSGNGDVATGVDGSGDSSEDSTYSPTPTGRLSWIDLYS